MRCRVCRSGISPSATTCPCGYDLSTGEVANAMVRARRDLRAGRKLQLFGLGAALAGAAMVALPYVGALAASLLDSFVTKVDIRLVALVVDAPIVGTIYGLGRGTWLRFDARRRLGAAGEIQRPAPARVVRRGRARARLAIERAGG